jgi:hypothetical protein
MALGRAPGLDVGGGVEAPVILQGAFQCVLFRIFAGHEPAHIIGIGSQIRQAGQDHDHHAGASHLELAEAGGLESLFVLGLGQNQKFPLFQTER